MIYLDTHIVVWLYAGLTKKFTTQTKKLMDNNDLYISNMAKLELQYLHEIGRITDNPGIILNELSQSIGLKISTMNTESVFDTAMNQSWTRDVFDRVITSEAISMDCILITKDKNILSNYKKAFWR